MTKSLICILKSQLQAESVITRLRARGVGIPAISLVMRDRKGVLGLARDRDSQIGNERKPGVAAAAPLGGAVGGVLGMLIDIGIQILPGAGAHITAGPVTHALMDPPPKSTGPRLERSSRLEQALMQMGLPGTRAATCDQSVTQGHLLLIVELASPEELGLASAVLLEARAEEMAEMESAATGTAPAC